MSQTRALKKIWQIRFHLHKKGYQAQIVESSKTRHRHYSHTGTDKDMANEIAFTIKKTIKFK